MKPWYSSRTILAALVSGILAIVAIFFKYDIQEFSGGITDAILAAIALGSMIVTISGRIRAKDQIGKTIPGGIFNPHATVKKPERMNE